MDLGGRPPRSISNEVEIAKNLNYSFGNYEISKIERYVFGKEVSLSLFNSD